MLPLNPLAPVTDYQSMLNRIFWFTTAAALAAVWLLRMYVPAADALLAKVDAAWTIDSKNLSTTAGYLLPALAVGIGFRVFRVHAKVSDWLGIRECFDLDVILADMAEQLNIDLAQFDRTLLRRARHGLMRKAFYPFVSGSQAPIDQQLILQALDAWSWFWVGVEATLVFALAAFGLIAFNVHAVGFQILGGVIAFTVIGLPAIRNQCRRFAIAQVRAILEDPARAAIAYHAFAEAYGASQKYSVDERRRAA
jgi:hypothetical protein